MPDGEKKKSCSQLKRAVTLQGAAQYISADDWRYQAVSLRSQRSVVRPDNGPARGGVISALSDHILHTAPN